MSRNTLARIRTSPSRLPACPLARSLPLLVFARSPCLAHYHCVVPDSLHFLHCHGRDCVCAPAFRARAGGQAHFAMSSVSTPALQGKSMRRMSDAVLGSVSQSTCFVPVVAFGRRSPPCARRLAAASRAWVQPTVAASAIVWRLKFAALGSPSASGDAAPWWSATFLLSRATGRHTRRFVSPVLHVCTYSYAQRGRVGLACR